MAACSECGKESMSFTCSYCGKSFCSDHRLPENHDCDKLEEELEKKQEEDGKWFENKDKKSEEKRRGRREPPKKPSLAEDILNVFKDNISYSIIAVTVFFFVLQPFLPGVSPPISQEAFQMVQNNPFELSPLILYPSLEYLMERPWTLFTVMLMHGGLLHIFANIVTFYFFGKPIENIIGGRETLKLYLGAGLISSLAIVGFQNLLNMIHGVGMSPIVGASGAVVAFIGAVAILYPDAEVLLYFVVPMKIKTAVYAFGAIEAVNIVLKLFNIYLPLIGGFASSAHLAGLLIGIWYGRKIKDEAGRMSVFDPMQF